MSYHLRNNRTILYGFVLAAIAIAGMSIAVIQQYSALIDMSVIREVSMLPVPLKSFNAQNTDPEEVIMEAETEIDDYSVVQSAITSLDLPAVSSPATTFERTLADEKLWVNVQRQKAQPPVAVQLEPEIPSRIVIPTIGLDAPVVTADVEFEKIWGKEFLQWYVPNKFAAGWHSTSARLGEPGNTVLNGHHNAYGEVFKHLVDLEAGDIIQVESENNLISYQITNKMIFAEKYEQLDVRVSNAQWLLPSVDERLTLISCWPYETNTHRLIIVAKPISKEKITQPYK